MKSNRRISTVLRYSLQALLLVLPVVVAISSLKGLLSSRLWSPSKIEDIARAEQLDQMSKMTQLRAEISSFQSDLDNLKKSLATINDDQKTAVRLQELSGQLELTTNRLKALETALVENPEKALSIPLLRKDLSALQQSLDVQRTAARGELERVYDFNKWFFGLFAALAVSIVGVAATTIFKDRKAKAD